MHRVFVSLACCAGICVSSGCRNPEDDTRFPGTSALDHSDNPHPDNPQIELTLLRIVGSRDGLVSFGQIGRGAIREDGLFVISDPKSCELHFFDGQSTALLGTFGRCGNGPGEFRAVMSLQFVGDTLIAFDASTSQLVAILPPSTELARRSVIPHSSSHARPTQMLVANDSQLVGTAPVVPTKSRPDSARNELLLVVDRTSGNVTHRALRPPPVGEDNDFAFLNNAEICLRPGHGRPTLVLAMNHWRFQAAILTMPRLALSGSISSDVPWIHPRALPRSQPGRAPSSYAAGIACAQNVAFLWHRERVVDPTRQKVPSFRMEAWTYSGTRLLALETSSIGDVLLDRILAASDDRILLRGLTGGGTPVVMDFAIRWPHQIRMQSGRRGGDQSGSILSTEP